MGQKDDTRENSCVTDRIREKNWREGKRGWKAERDGLTESEKPHTYINILVSIFHVTGAYRRACARVHRRHASATKCVYKRVLLCDRQSRELNESTPENASTYTALGGFQKR